MDNTQFGMMIGLVIASFCYLNYITLRSFMKLNDSVKDLSEKLQSINDKMDESTERIEKLLKQIHGN